MELWGQLSRLQWRMMEKFKLQWMDSRFSGDGLPLILSGSREKFTFYIPKTILPTTFYILLTFRTTY